MRNMRAALLLAVVAAGAACSDAPSGGGESDAGLDAAGPRPTTPEPPLPPALPVFTPCPDDWREVVDSGDPLLVTCEPVEEGCPAGDYAEGVPAAAVHVLAGAAAGGDGTRARPYGSLALAISSAAPGAAVAVGKGIYDEEVVLASSVTLWGACAAATGIVSSSASDSDPVVSVTAGTATIRGLRIGGARPGVTVDGGQVTLESVLVDAATGSGLLATSGGTRLEADGLVVRGTVTRPDGTGGSGVVVSAGAAAELDRALIEGSQEFGVYVQDDSAFTARDLVVRDTGAGPGGTGRFGIAAIGGSTDVERAYLARNRGAGVVIEGVGTRLVARDATIVDTLPERSGRFGLGLQASPGTTLELERGSLERNRMLGALSYGEGATLLLRDVAIRQTASQELDGLFGRGIEASSGGRVEAWRVLVDASREVGVLTTGAGSTALLEDIVVERTLERSCVGGECEGERGGIGLTAARGGAIDATRFRSSDHVLCGVQVGPEGDVALHDGEVSRNPIGANVQVQEFDLARLQDGVFYVDNERTLDSTALPVPQPAAL